MQKPAGVIHLEYFQLSVGILANRQWSHGRRIRNHRYDESKENAEAQNSVVWLQREERGERLSKTVHANNYRRRPDVRQAPSLEHVFCMCILKVPPTK